MTDIALIWDGVNGRADFAIENGDLVMDQGLTTALIISLFCDRTADPSDVVPDGGSDPRGWWGDTPRADTLADATGIDLTGSRLWLMARALQTQDTLNLAQAYVLEALQWMIEDNIAETVACTPSYPARGWLRLDIAVVQSGTPSVYDFVWSAT